MFYVSLLQFFYFIVVPIFFKHKLKLIYDTAILIYSFKMNKIKLKMKFFNRSVKVKKEKPFDLLPDEMIICLLSFVDVDSLLNCRIVCKRWRSFIDAHVFHEKASRGNEIVNNGKGYYSFSQIDSNTVRKLEFPWYVFYAICKYDPFNRNLVQNHCGQDNFNHWALKNNTLSRFLWIIEQIPVGADPLPDDPDFDGHTSCFVSTYRLCSKCQTITLKNHGLTSTLMKLLKPDILVSEWYSGRFDCGCKYAFRANVHDSTERVLEQHNYNDNLLQGQANKWTKISHIFKNQSNASSISIYHAGVDTQYWSGHYGSKVSGTVLKVMLPIKLKCTESRIKI
ncbi:F-box domain,Galactose-binding domain-like,F-box associated (FBA) domain [Cinara cedri]|uniref:F-box domain,Galactose-binding domain-like,F-box associated (FBA) domain n=1 Tax=Cinara cedri TaxID=506608 RepID=A0A5E4MRV0_9HEMI|nr:F-box domain,Galactose-binding domain-like,F-box associated (FBA) domain [Cinara cedri]